MRGNKLNLRQAQNKSFVWKSIYLLYEYSKGPFWAAWGAICWNLVPRCSSKVKKDGDIYTTEEENILEIRLNQRMLKPLEWRSAYEKVKMLTPPWLHPQIYTELVKWSKLHRSE